MITRSVLTTAGAIVSLVGCASILSIEPTQVIDGDGGIVGSGDSGGDGSNIVVNNGATPKISADCASAINNIDPSSKEANAIVADDNGVFWAIPHDSSTSTIFSLIAGAQKTISTYDPADSTKSEPSVIGFALDAKHLYWTSWNTYSGANGPPRLREWSRSDGSIVDADVTGIGGGVSELALATNTNTLFFGNWQKQGQQANLLSISAPFTAAQKPAILSGGLQSPLHFASFADAVYYDEATTSDLTDQNQVALESATMGGADEIETSANDVEDLVVDETSRVYWAQANDHVIKMHEVERTSPTQIFTSTFDYPHLLAYDGDHHMLYVIVSSQENVWSLQRISTTQANAQPVMCVDNMTDASAVQYWRGHVYFSGVTTGASGLFDLTIK